MELSHNLQTVDIDYAAAVARHSADECVIYKTVDAAPLYLGFYFPADYSKTQTYPAFVFIHGGAWASKKVFEDQTHWQGDYLGYLARFYADRGFVCISIDYRLIADYGQVDGHGLIDCYDDCCDAVDFIIDNASHYGIDPDRLYLLGESAGGHLAGAVSTFRHKKSYHFETVFLINPITDLNDPQWEKYVPKKSTNNYLSQLSFPERVQFLSPLYRVDNHTSPIVLIHGNADSVVNPEHAFALYRRMRDWSKDCNLHILDQTHHAFLLPEYSKEFNACRTAIKIINCYLHI